MLHASAFTPRGIAACGHDASQVATSEHSAPTAPAAFRTIRAIAGATGWIDNPSSPRSNARDTSGPARMFASGEISESIPKVATVSGMVAACATSVIETGSLTKRIRAGSASCAHLSVKRANRSSPATAATDSWNPRSNAAGGHVAIPMPAAAASAPSPSARRFPAPTSTTTVAINQARTADGCTPEATTYSPRVTTTAAALIHLRARSRASSQLTTAATTTRWPPLTATRCVRPVVRKALSAGVPARRRRSPRTTPASKSPPGPGTPSRARRALVRHGSIAPRRLRALPSIFAERAETEPQTPARWSRRPNSSSPGALEVP